MKLLIALGLTAILSFSVCVHAQDDASELEELEKELDALEAEGGDVVTESSDFTEEQSSAEDISDVESDSFEQDLEDVLEGTEEDIATVPDQKDDNSLIEENIDEQNASSPGDQIEVPTEDLFEDIPEQIAEPEEEQMVIPGADSDTQEEIAAPETLQEELPVATNEVPEMLAPLPDEPNLSKERSIFNAYQYIKNYANLDETWSQASAGREAESYGVQSGDNLWDISLTLFGNPYFWPKIWQINSGITNPHDIRPGDPLVFVEGDLQAAPQLSQGEVGEENLPQELPPEEELLAEIPELPALQEQRPPLTEIPPSLAAWHLTTNKKDDFGADKITKVANQVPNVIRLSSYVVEEEPPVIGKIVEIEMGSDTANLYQNVFIESDQIGVGDSLVSYAVKDKLHDKKGEVVGYAIELHGTLKVTEAVSSEKNVFKAMVTYLASPIAKGTFIRKGAYPLKSINKQPTIVSVDTEIIGAEFDDHRRVLATGSIVYLANGSDAGIQEGTALRIIKNQKIRNKATLVENNTNVIGVMQIIDVQTTRSTGVISSAIEAVAVGDLTGAATVLSYGPSDTGSSNVDNFDEFDDIEQDINDETDFFDE